MCICACVHVSMRLQGKRNEVRTRACRAPIGDMLEILRGGGAWDVCGVFALTNIKECGTLEGRRGRPQKWESITH